MRYRSVILGRTEFLVLHYLVVGANDHGRDPLKDIYEYGLESEEAYEALSQMTERLRSFALDEATWAGDEGLESRYLEWLIDRKGHENRDIRDMYIRQLTVERDQAREELRQAQVDRDAWREAAQLGADIVTKSNEGLRAIRTQLEKIV